MALSVVFMGTPAFAVPTLQRIHADGHHIAAVYTQPPRPAGRGLSETRSPVHEAASMLDLPIVMPRTLRIPAAGRLFASHVADVAVVVAFGLILPKAILDAPRHGAINLHPSALPRWRGAAPIQRALMAGDRETALMVMRMDEGLDTGPVALAERVAIGEDETAGDLAARLSTGGADLIGRALARLEAGELTFTPQAEAGATYAAKIGKDEARIDWTRPAASLHAQIRGLSPFPGAWFTLDPDGKPERVKVVRSRRAEGSGGPGAVLSFDPLVIATGDGALELVEVQRAGRRPVAAREFVRGARLAAGARLG